MFERTGSVESAAAEFNLPRDAINGTVRIGTLKVGVGTTNDQCSIADGATIEGGS
ncbi:MAG: hypothetical protein U0Y08_07240 [Bacteroidia bacterium]